MDPRVCGDSIVATKIQRIRLIDCPDTEERIDTSCGFVKEEERRRKCAE